jgi:hypothetical protein
MQDPGAWGNHAFMALHASILIILKLLNVDFNANPDSAFYSSSDPNPYPASQNNANPNSLLADL